MAAYRITIYSAQAELHLSVRQGATELYTSMIDAQHFCLGKPIYICTKKLEIPYHAKQSLQLRIVNRKAKELHTGFDIFQVILVPNGCEEAWKRVMNLLVLFEQQNDYLVLQSKPNNK